MLKTGHHPGRPPPHTFSPHRAHFAEETGTHKTLPQHAFYASTYHAVGDNSEDEQESVEGILRLTETGLHGSMLLPRITSPFTCECGYAASIMSQESDTSISDHSCVDYVTPEDWVTAPWSLSHSPYTSTIRSL